MKQTAKEHIAELIRRYPVLEPCREAVEAAAQTMADCFARGGRMLVCGNGGSASDAQHIVGELMKGFTLPRHLPEALCARLREVSPRTADYLIENLQQALPVVSLVGENALTTAFSNDQAPDLVFAQQVLGHGKPGDVLFAISTSGNSANVIYAMQMARTMGITTVALTGLGGGKMAPWSDVLVDVPERITYRIQELHLPVYHALCLAIEEEFFGGSK